MYTIYIQYHNIYMYIKGFSGGSVVENLPAKQET